MLGRVADRAGTSSVGVPRDALEAWLNDAPVNARALFIVAAAVYAALHPEEETIKFSGPDVVHALVARERARGDRQLNPGGRAIEVAFCRKESHRSVVIAARRSDRPS